MGAGYTLHSHVFGAPSAEWVLTSRLPSRWPRPSPLARSSLSQAGALGGRSGKRGPADALGFFHWEL